MRNPVWLMSSAYPKKDLSQLIEIASRVGLQGLELCVFRIDGTRSDHVATHLPYEGFGSEQAKQTIELFNQSNLHLSIGAFENLIGGEDGQRIRNQNHLLKLIRLAALLGGDENGITVGTFVGYNHQWDLDEYAFEKNLYEYKRVFDPIITYAEDLGVTIAYENCPMEGWRPSSYSTTMNNLTSTLAARKLMYELIPSKAHGETYDPSHDIWQFVNPVEVLKHSDLGRIKSIHLKTTRMNNDSASTHWGQVFGKQKVNEALAKRANVPVPANDWDRFSYEPMLPGFGGTDSMDWRSFISHLNDHAFGGVFSIENEAANSKNTNDEMAIEQGIAGTLSFVKPMIWPLEQGKGYQFGTQDPLEEPASRDIPIRTMKELTT